MTLYEVRKGDYLISTNKSLLNFDIIHGFLRESYWSPGIPVETVRRAAENSFAFGIYHHGKQVGYARIVSDQATFAYLADVFVVEDERGKGLSKWLMEAILAAPFLQGLRRWMLATLDAHGLYKQFGFEPLDKPELFLQIARPNMYQQAKTE